jgi:hypothetical protein
MKQTKLIILFSLITLALQAETIDYKPSIGGTIRGKYEYNTSLEAHRFQVRNARYSIRGAVSAHASYKAEIDLSNEGQIRMLDAFVQMNATPQLAFVIGQQKVPFSTDNLRSPHDLLFANRSFLGKQLAGLRDVGATIEYDFNEIFPLEFIAGVYNGKGLYNQQEWRNELSYALRTVYSPTKTWEFQLNYNTIQPYELRLYIFNGGVKYATDRWIFETEVYHKQYDEMAFPDTRGFFAMVSYDIPTPKFKSIESISPRVRYDYMSNDNNGRIDDITNSYIVNDVERSRFTSGINLNFKKPFINELRLNYEHYMYAAHLPNKDSKLVIEFVAKF